MKSNDKTKSTALNYAGKDKQQKYLARLFDELPKQIGYRQPVSDM